MDRISQPYPGIDSDMTSATTFTLDGSLAPSDAAQVLEDLRTWLGSEQRRELDIAPLPAHPQLPTQPAIQLLFAAIRQMNRQGGTDHRLTERAREICHRLGQSALIGNHEPEGRNG